MSLKEISILKRIFKILLFNIFPRWDPIHEIERQFSYARSRFVVFQE